MSEGRLKDFPAYEALLAFHSMLPSLLLQGDVSWTLPQLHHEWQLQESGIVVASQQ
jgi:hypothetical protein